MRFFNFLNVIVAAGLAPLGLAIDPTADPADVLAELQRQAASTIESSESQSKRSPSGCTLATAAKRTGW